ncbi:MAG: YggS family pyridoxal phosphate-dependent enzyme [Lysobacterales bacterium CG_4_10_14_3_um_filter_64_11]|nr:MAG: YggS family pyridoxal phosphate-dependent enzyme [Xanthomonadales bacterium CG_4_10_14_3_um_filter_64_11]
MSSPEQRLNSVLQRIATATQNAGCRDRVRLLAVSKTQSDTAIRALAAAGQRAFGENYVQEASAKHDALRDLALEWHLIGHLQSNKAREAATRFDWVQSVDRDSVIAALARHRSDTQAPLNVLIQVNIDGERSKSGCLPEQIAALAARIACQSRLCLRGLMAIPDPEHDAQQRAISFSRMQQAYCQLRDSYPRVDTLSMGMSGDFEQAIAHGANLVRIGTALFGPRE